VALACVVLTGCGPEQPKPGELPSPEYPIPSSAYPSGAGTPDPTFVPPSASVPGSSQSVAPVVATRRP
jgi:hypothetical protein